MPVRKCFRFIKTSFRKHLIRSLIVTLLILLGLIYTSAELTSRSSFCRSCHNMKPYYASWQASNHKDVECVKCHIRPGFKGKIHAKFEGLIQLVSYVSRAYRSRVPAVNIPDDSCLKSGCHDTRLLKPGVQFKDVHFDHKDHLT